jgi:polyphosphate kinase 2 (PPK2 family)
MARKKKSGARSARREAFAFEVYPAGTLQLDAVDLSQKVEDDEAYEKELEALQQELYRLQIQQFLAKRHTVFAFEGWDASGKGGAIKRLTAQMDPRGYKVWPISAPNAQEAANHYLWRFWQRVPARGELAVFDRSWYGRVLVERVEKLATPAEWGRAYDEINAFERMLHEEHLVLVKFWLHISDAEQLERFEARRDDPLKAWKLTDEDWRNRAKRADYETAVDEMLERTSAPHAPWTVVEAESKRYARVKVAETVADRLAAALGR